MYVEEMRHFLDCVAGKAVPLLDGRGARLDLQVVEAAKQASREARMISIERRIK
jgi:predicted dehydrogenase